MITLPGWRSRLHSKMQDDSNHVDLCDRTHQEDVMQICLIIYTSFIDAFNHWEALFLLKLFSCSDGLTDSIHYTIHSQTMLNISQE